MSNIIYFKDILKCSIKESYPQTLALKRNRQQKKNLSDTIKANFVNSKSFECKKIMKSSLIEKKKNEDSK